MQHVCTCRLRKYSIDDLTVVRVEGTHVHLAEEDALRLRDALQELVEAGKLRLSLDLGNVTFLTSTVVEVLLSLNRQLETAGGHLSLFNLSPIVAEVFAVLKLANVLDIRPSRR